MSNLKKLAAILGSLTGYLVAANLAGVVVCFFLDVWPGRWMSDMVFYAVWFVLGAFLGVLHYQTAGDWLSGTAEGDWAGRAGARATGTLVIWVSAAELALLAALFHALWWHNDMAFESFVPDNAGLTLLHFAAILGAMWVSRRALHETMPRPGPGSGRGRAAGRP